MTDQNPRDAALARLQASRSKLAQSMRPGQEPSLIGALEHPLRFLRHWWRQLSPALMAGQWLRASAGGTPEALKEVGGAAVSSTRSWVREHPLASVTIAAALGALLIGKRGMLWGLLLGVGQGAIRQGKGWLMHRLTDPALYMALVTAMMAKQGAEAFADATDPMHPDMQTPPDEASDGVAEQGRS